MNSRWLKLAALTVVALWAFAPDAEAQRRRGGGRGGRGGGAGGARRAGRAVGRQRAAPTPAPTPPPARTAPGAPVTAPKGGELKKAEDEFRAMLARIDRAIAESERRSQVDDWSGSPKVQMLPSDIERGTLEWRALQRPVFMTADYDHSGWLSFRETRASLGFDRAEFALYDKDRDGRISLREFGVRYDDVVAQTGAFRVPIADEAGLATKSASPAALRNEFDADSDGALDAQELERLMARWNRPDLSPASILDKLDLDGDGKLGHAELATLSHLSESSLLSASDGARGRRAADVIELFGARTPRETGLGAARAPERVVGPIPHFVRLDLNRDGFVTLAELLSLQEGSNIYTRPNAVLAALDLDGDGKLSAKEFASGFSAAGSSAHQRAR